MLKKLNLNVTVNILLEIDYRDRDRVIVQIGVKVRFNLSFYAVQMSEAPEPALPRTPCDNFIAMVVVQ